MGIKLEYSNNDNSDLQEALKRVKQERRNLRNKRNEKFLADNNLNLNSDEGIKRFLELLKKKFDQYKELMLTEIRKEQNTYTGNRIRDSLEEAEKHYKGLSRKNSTNRYVQFMRYLKSRIGVIKSIDKNIEGYEQDKLDKYEKTKYEYDYYKNIDHDRRRQLYAREDTLVNRDKTIEELNQQIKKAEQKVEMIDKNLQTEKQYINVAKQNLDLSANILSIEINGREKIKKDIEIQTEEFKNFLKNNDLSQEENEEIKKLMQAEQKLIAEKTRLENENRELKKINNKLKREIYANKKYDQTSEDIESQLKEGIERAKTIKENIKTINNLTKEIAQERDQNKELLDKFNKLFNKMEAKEEEITNLQISLKKKDEVIKTLKSKNKELKKKVKQKEGEIGKLKEKLNTQKEEVEKIKLELEAEINNLKSEQRDDMKEKDSSQQDIQEEAPDSQLSQLLDIKEDAQQIYSQADQIAAINQNDNESISLNLSSNNKIEIYEHNDDMRHSESNQKSIIQEEQNQIIYQPLESLGDDSHVDLTEKYEARKHQIAQNNPNQKEGVMFLDNVSDSDSNHKISAHNNVTQTKPKAYYNPKIEYTAQKQVNYTQNNGNGHLAQEKIEKTIDEAIDMSKLNQLLSNLDNNDQQQIRAKTAYTDNQHYVQGSRNINSNDISSQNTRVDTTDYQKRLKQQYNLYKTRGVKTFVNNNKQTASFQEQLSQNKTSDTTKPPTTGSEFLYY